MRIRYKNIKSILLLFFLGRLPFQESRPLFKTIRALQSNVSSCSFDDLFASVCSLQDYCATSLAPPVIASCSGDISAEWFILIQMEEICYETELRESSFARHSPNATAELPTRGFCSLESVYFNFRGAVLENAQHQEIMTHPVKGLMQQVTLYQACDDTVADSFFGRGYCADPCPQTVLQGSLVCQQPCRVCADQTQVLDCSNIHPTLLEECGNEESFTGTLIHFLRNETSSHSLWSDQADTSPVQEEPALEGDETSSTTSHAENTIPSAAFAIFSIILLLANINSTRIL
jgi:hypothetical protein